MLPRTAVDYQYYVRLRDGPAGLPRFADEAKTLNLGTGTVGYSSEDGQAATVEASIHPQAIGWWVLAALAALVGLAVIGQALFRQSVVESEDYPTLAAVGAEPAPAGRARDGCGTWSWRSPVLSAPWSLATALSPDSAARRGAHCRELDRVSL